MAPIALILSSVLLGVVGQLVLKSGLVQIGPLSLGGGGFLPVAWRIAANPRVWGGLALYGISTFFWLAALSQVELSFAYPFISLSYVLILLASWSLFNEELSLVKVAGVAAICFGVYSVAAG